MSYFLDDEAFNYFQNLFEVLEENLALADEANQLLEERPLWPDFLVKSGIPLIAPAESDYAKILKNISFEKDFWSLEQHKIKAYTPFPYDVTKVKGSLYREKPSLAYSDKDFSYLELTQYGIPWMSLCPHEITTMQKPIKEAHGKVLTFGLGLGYFAYMSSKKESVESLTIVEQSETLINLFKEKILPRFPNQAKIKIINKEALNFAKSEDLAIYDYVFSDLHHTALDGFGLNLALANIFKTKNNCKFRIWIEEEFLILIRRLILTLLSDESIRNDDLNEFPGEREASKTIIAILRTKKWSKEELMGLLSNKNIRKILPDLINGFEYLN